MYGENNAICYNKIIFPKKYKGAQKYKNENGPGRELYNHAPSNHRELNS